MTKQNDDDADDEEDKTTLTARSINTMTTKGSNNKIREHTTPQRIQEMNKILKRMMMMIMTQDD